ncbi:WXG100 family type VII secretion target [Dactylosporangium sp. NBC_01737]|uniref:WXG100 family type VII secretion target n=1 Tax=Dactylosporangium sp. NBC_01737 TaxID=2975959 RepID=UPI002E1000F5|nr:WXG100 family type VII secretion target [Dactylosporangium sp. NBC_01737]
MADYNVNPNGLLDTADELSAIQSRLRSSLDALSTAVANFENANNGNAVVGYQGAQTMWNDAMGRMDAAVLAAQSALHNIHDQYRLGDNKSAAMFNGLV